MLNSKKIAALALLSVSLLGTGTTRAQATPTAAPASVNAARFPSLAFTPSNTALLLIDFQVGTVQLIRNRPPAEVLHNGVTLAKMAKILNIPTVITSSLESNGFQGPVTPELGAVLPKEFDARIQRKGEVDAFTAPAFAAAVKATGKKNLIIAGVTTDVCLVHMVQRAEAMGYNVQVVVDAAGSNSDVSEQIALDTIRASGASLTTIPQLVSGLAGNWGVKPGSDLLNLLTSDYQQYIIEHPGFYK
ncbi:isochorismatase family protein [Deinococcus ruber]|uniref:Isochorismatase n=1 Tax=Deinococcus ruber TaxID=1848197 RepID=A0A918C0C6_9DEIO|nr:isochorismatase family protein [Deinococcus ruber]GGQ99312.1 isochorismatase [Deinococcus ruber]